MKLILLYFLDYKWTYKQLRSWASMSVRSLTRSLMMTRAWALRLRASERERETHTEEDRSEILTPLFSKKQIISSEFNFTLKCAALAGDASLTAKIRWNTVTWLFRHLQDTDPNPDYLFSRNSMSPSVLFHSHYVWKNNIILFIHFLLHASSTIKEVCTCDASQRVF